MKLRQLILFWFLWVIKFFFQLLLCISLCSSPVLLWCAYVLFCFYLPCLGFIKYLESIVDAFNHFWKIESPLSLQIYQYLFPSTSLPGTLFIHMLIRSQAIPLASSSISSIIYLKKIFFQTISDSSIRFNLMSYSLLNSHFLWFLKMCLVLEFPFHSLKIILNIA